MVVASAPSTGCGILCVQVLGGPCVRIAMAGWLHGVFVVDWLFVFPLCVFSVSLFCNWYANGSAIVRCEGRSRSNTTCRIKRGWFHTQYGITQVIHSTLATLRYLGPPFSPAGGDAPPTL